MLYQRPINRTIDKLPSSMTPGTYCSNVQWYRQSVVQTSGENAHLPGML